MSTKGLKTRDVILETSLCLAQRLGWIHQQTPPTDTKGTVEQLQKITRTLVASLGEDYSTILR